MCTIFYKGILGYAEQLIGSIDILKLKYNGVDLFGQVVINIEVPSIEENVNIKIESSEKGGFFIVIPGCIEISLVRKILSLLIGTYYGMIYSTKTVYRFHISSNKSIRKVDDYKIIDFMLTNNDLTKGLEIGE